MTGHIRKASGSSGGEVAKFTQEQVELIARTVAKGCDADELALFLYQCQRTGLDPFSRQIHAVKRYDPESGRKVMMIQTGIDGYRLIAERTGNYAPGREVEYLHDEEGNFVAAKAFVRKKVGDEWHEFSATAYFEEFAQTNKDGHLTRMWREKPRHMTAKCAEAIALRKGFPLELSGVYTSDEAPEPDEPPAERPRVSRAQATVDHWTARLEACQSAGEVNAVRTEMAEAKLPSRLKEAIMPAYKEALKRTEPKAIPAAPAAPPPPAASPEDEEQARVKRLAQALNLSDAGLAALVRDLGGDPANVTPEVARQVLETLEERYAIEGDA
jgi:phage recombination protein Bet